jgi:hypothetical protein
MKSRLFAQRPVRPGELPLIMRKHIATGTLGSAWGNLITGIIYIYFGNAIGLTRMEWGILTGIGSWSVVMQPLGALIGERAGSRRMVWFWTALIDRALRMAGVLAAWLLWRAGRTESSLLFILVMSLGPMVGNLAPGLWFGWFATIIPKEVQGAFWGRRDSWISLVVILVTLPSGLVMDIVPRDLKMETATGILLAASVMGLVDLLVHRTIPEPPYEAAPIRGALARILVPLRDREFRPWLVFTGAWNLSQSLGGSLAPLYLMENIGFKNDMLGGMFSMTIVGLLATFLAARRMGRMVDRFGIKRVLVVSHFLWTLVPAVWLLALPGPGALLWVGLAGVLGTVFFTAATNASVKLATRFPASDDGGMYMAISTVVGSLANGLGAFLAGAFLTAVAGWSVTVFGLVVSAFPALFLVSFVARILSASLLLPRVRTSAGPSELETPFLLPLFFESVPGLSRLRRRRRPPGR